MKPTKSRRIARHSENIYPENKENSHHIGNKKNPGSLWKKFPRNDSVTARIGKNIFRYSSKRAQLPDPVGTILSIFTREIKPGNIKRKIIRLNFDEFPFQRCYKRISKRLMTKTSIKHVVMLLKIQWDLTTQEFYYLVFTSEHKMLLTAIISR